MGNTPPTTLENLPSTNTPLIISSANLPSSSSFECLICTETQPSEKSFNGNKKNRCSHLFCVDCIAKYIQIKVEDDKVADIRCPDTHCGRSLDPITCRPIISAKVFEEWCDVLCESTLVTGQNRFYCPFIRCSAPFLNECGPLVRISQCPACNRLFCFGCKRPWHAGFGCDESRTYTSVDDVLFGMLAERKNWTRCPVCKHYVERVSGCLSVKCRCGVRFCYGCGKETVGGNNCNCVVTQQADREERNIVICFTIVLMLLLIALGYGLYLVVH